MPALILHNMKYLVLGIIVDFSSMKDLGSCFSESHNLPP